MSSTARPSSSEDNAIVRLLRNRPLNYYELCDRMKPWTDKQVADALVGLLKTGDVVRIEGKICSRYAVGDGHE